MKNEVLKGNIYYADLSHDINCENKNIRPVLVIQSNNGNKFSPTTIVCYISSQIDTIKMPTHVKVTSNNQNNLKKDSVILTEQIRTIDKKRLKEYIGYLDDFTMIEVRKALFTTFGEETYLK